MMSKKLLKQRFTRSLLIRSLIAFVLGVLLGQIIPILAR